MPSMKLRVLLCTVLLFAAALPAVAHAADLAELKAQKAALSAQLETAGAAFRRALYSLENNADRIATLEKRTKRSQADLARAQQNLTIRAQTIYRLGGTDFVSVLLGSTDFVDLMTRMDFVRSIAEQDAVQIRRVKTLRAKLAAETTSLGHEHSTLESNAYSMRVRRRILTKLMVAKQREYEAAKAALGPGAANVRGSYAPAGPNGMVFPVDGPNYYDDSWGAARSGGRTHNGTDIMAASGTPCVAVLSGTVSSKEGGLGGKVIWLDADNGWRFYYAHLSGWAVRSGHVRAGQLIGYVGATGNAAGGAPHCHFEIHPNSGGAVDPHPYLKRMQ